MMYNKKYIIAGLVIFVGLFTLPFTMNVGSKEYKRPALALPAGETECIAPVEYMRAEHMTLLNTWRDQALREDKRVYYDQNGKAWEVSLQNTCQQCHANKAEFCDTCHNSNNVTPYCWDCHVDKGGVR